MDKYKLNNNRNNNSNTTIASWLLVICKTLTELGVEPDAALRPLGLEKSDIAQNPNQRISIKTMTQLWRNLIQLTGHKDIGFLVAKRVKPQHFRGLGFAFLASKTLRGCFNRIAKYSDSISDSVDVSIEQGIDKLALCIAPKSNVDIAEESIDAFMLLLHLSFMQVLDADDIDAEVEFCCAARGMVLQYQAHFGSNIVFNSDKNRYWLTTRCLDQPLVLGDEALASQNDQVVESYLAEIYQDEKQDSQAWLLSINAEINKQIIRNQLSAVTLAKTFNISERSLRRKLSATGTNFKTLTEHNKKLLAEQWLTKENKSITDVCFLLGYQDTSNFTRAFKRWFGVTPSDYMKGIRNI